MRIEYVIQEHTDAREFVCKYNSFHRKKLPNDYVERLCWERSLKRTEEYGWKLAEDFPAGLAFYSEESEDGTVCDYVVFCKKGKLHGFKFDEWYRDDYDDEEEDEEDEWDDYDEDEE